MTKVGTIWQDWKLKSILKLTNRSNEKKRIGYKKKHTD